jgi:hypothetical protein
LIQNWNYTALQQCLGEQGGGVEIILAFILKFFSVLYGAIYGVLVSIPLLKEWVARHRVGVHLEEASVEIKNKGWRPFLMLDGHVLAGTASYPVARRVLTAGETLAFARPDHGDVFVWLRVIDLATGKELVISDMRRAPA